MLALSSYKFQWKMTKTVISLEEAPIFSSQSICNNIGNETHENLIKHTLKY